MDFRCLGKAIGITLVISAGGSVVGAAIVEVFILAERFLGDLGPALLVILMLLSAIVTMLYQECVDECTSRRKPTKRKRK